MSIVITPSPVISPTSQDATAPFRAVFSWGTGESASGTAENKVLVPNALTKKVMAETEAGSNVVICSSIDDLFKQLDS